MIFLKMTSDKGGSALVNLNQIRAVMPSMDDQGKTDIWFVNVGTAPPRVVVTESVDQIEQAIRKALQ